MPDDTMPGLDRSHLRPLEAAILRLHEEGVEPVEIGRRVGKKPGTIERILEMIDYKATIETSPPERSTPTPLERTIGRLRDQGETYGEIGNRLGRSGANVRRVEEMADLRARS